MVKETKSNLFQGSGQGSPGNGGSLQLGKGDVKSGSIKGDNLTMDKSFPVLSNRGRSPCYFFSSKSGRFSASDGEWPPLFREKKSLFLAYF